MKNIFAIAALAAVITLGSCIRNDIPIARVEADITLFEVNGQIGSAVIDRTNRTVSVEVDESVDLASLNVVKFNTEAADGETDITSTLTQGDKISLLSPLTVTLTTYQDYEWSVSAVQNIERYMTVENQVGEALMDPQAGTVTLRVAQSQPLDEITVTGMKLGQAGSVTSPDFTTVKDFTNPVEFTVTYKDRSQKWTVSVSHGDLLTGESNPWAKFVYLTGYCLNNANSATFEYKEESESSWTAVPLEDITVEGDKLSCKVEGLEPVTSYEFRVVQGENFSSTASFVTEPASPMLNMGFDDWYSELSGTKKVIWYANKDLSEENYIWDSGNKGVTLLSDSTTTPEEENLAVEGEGKKAAKLESRKVIIAFAAGSLFTGKFLKLEGLGASLSFGVPYDSRPLALKGYYDYTPKTIDNAKAPYEELKGTTDRCHIYVILADREEPFEINTTTSTFIDVENDPTIIAYGELDSDQPTDGYREFTINLEYRDMVRKPNMVVVVATSSRYGDYFTGAAGSLLYVDEFEFLF